MKHIFSSWETKESHGSPMRLYVAHPDRSEPAPCIMVFQEAFGLNAHMRDVTERIAALGYIAVAPELFHRTAPNFEGDYNDISKSKPHMEELTNERLEADIMATYEWCKQYTQSDIDDIAAVVFASAGKLLL